LEILTTVELSQAIFMIFAIKAQLQILSSGNEQDSWHFG